MRSEFRHDKAIEHTLLTAAILRTLYMSGEVSDKGNTVAIMTRPMKMCQYMCICLCECLPFVTWVGWLRLEVVRTGSCILSCKYYKNIIYMASVQ